MGVADGVYMWKELGIDSGTMARTLMETCQHMVAAGCEDVYKGRTGCADHHRRHRIVSLGLSMGVHFCHDVDTWQAGQAIHNGFGGAATV